MGIQPEKLFRLLADPTRLRGVTLLYSEGRLCVCELVHALQLSQPKVSRHLAQLRDCGLVTDERRGQWVHYRLADDLPDWVYEVIAATERAAQCDDLLWKTDRQRLGAMPNRPEIFPDS